MAEMYLNALGNTQAKWLSVRQALIASNVANANVPGHRASDVRPMSEGQKSFSDMVRTNDKHLVSGLGNASGVGIASQSGWETYHSGGNVSVAQEMMKAGEVASAYQMNTSVMRSFHEMVITTFGT